MAKPLLSKGLNSTDAAISWFRNRVPMSHHKTRALEKAAQRQAFWVGNVSQLRLVNDVMDALQDALENGTTLEDFKDAVGDKLARAWGGEEPYHVENIFRTNIQRAYMAGRMAEIRDPVVARIRPFLRYDATLDEATCPICDGNDQVTLAADDPYWSSHTPPMHFQCRCTLVSLTEDDVGDKELGTDGSEPDAQEGFGAEPDLNDIDALDLTGIDPELLAAYGSK